MKHIKKFNEANNTNYFSNKQFQEIFYESEDVYGAIVDTDFNDMYYFVTLEYPKNDGETNIFQTHSTESIDAQIAAIDNLKTIAICSKKILQKLEAEGYEVTYKIDSPTNRTTFWIKRELV